MTGKISGKSSSPIKVTDRIVESRPGKNIRRRKMSWSLRSIRGGLSGRGHELTSLCMKLMEKYLWGTSGREEDPGLGCGSGILLSVELCWEAEILGIEIDEDAVRVARENVEETMWRMLSKSCRATFTKAWICKVDVIVANLMADLVDASFGGCQKAPDGGRHIPFLPVFW